MSDTDGHTDHAALDEAHELLRMWSMLFDTDKKQAVSRIAVGINALAAENAALRAYARAVTARCDEYIVRTSDLQAEHGVAAILADD
mgnify:CR=1 FL=1